MDDGRKTAMNYLATIGSDAYTIVLKEEESLVQAEINGAPMRIDLVHMDGENTYSLLIDGRSYTATVLEANERCRIMIDGAVYEVEVEQEDLARLRSEVKRKHRAGGEQIKAPMPGRVIAIEVKAGDTVAPGQGLIVIEAMKMENELRTHAGGVVKEVRAGVGDAVNKNDVLIVLGEESGASAPPA
jgi:biotin carboxyl carrier protein